MNEKLYQIIHHRSFVPSVVGALSFGAGVGFGYFLGWRAKENEYDWTVVVRDDDEEDSAAHILMDEKPTIVAEEVRMFLDEKLQQGTTVIIDAEDREEVEPEVIVRQTVFEREPLDEDLVEATTSFAGDDGEWDYNEELARRNPSQPYVIHRDEFFENDLGYSQSTLTYYAGDDILVDEDETPIYNHELIVGEMKFGHGSGDPNVFYVRNVKRRAEYEITRSEGKYTAEVLHIEIEENARTKGLKHSGPRRFQVE